MSPEVALSELLREITELRARLNVLRAGVILHPVMAEEAELRYGRVIGAMVAALAIRGRLELEFAPYAGVGLLPAVNAARAADPPAGDTLDAEEQRLMELLFANSEVIRLDRAGPGRAWDELATMAHRGLKADGLGWLSPERYRYLRRLTRLRKAVRDYARSAPPWNGDPELHRAGYPFAVLFQVEVGDFGWPSVPEAEACVPMSLAAVCQRAIMTAT